MIESIIQTGTSIVQSGIGPAVGVLLGTIFVRRDTKVATLEKLKSGKFAEVVDDLLESGQMTYMEYAKCNNFLHIAEKADQINREKKEKAKVKSSSSRRSEPLDFDWLMRFYDTVNSVTDDDMRNLWASILAGETVSPGRFSLRTLETIRNLLPTEADLFQKLAGNFVRDMSGNYCLIGTTENLLDINSCYGINDETLYILDDCGLIAGSRVEIELFYGDEDYCFAVDGLLMVLSSTNIDNKDAVIYSYPLSSAGKQLMEILEKSPNEEYFFDLGWVIQEHFSNYLNVSIHRVQHFIDDDLCEYDAEDLFKSYKPTGKVKMLTSLDE